MEPYLGRGRVPRIVRVPLLPPTAKGEMGKDKESAAWSKLWASLEQLQKLRGHQGPMANAQLASCSAAIVSNAAVIATFEPEEGPYNIIWKQACALLKLSPSTWSRADTNKLANHLS